MCCYSFLHLYLQFYFSKKYVKFKKVGHVTLAIHHPLCSTRAGLSTKEKMKCLALPVKKLWMGPKI